MIKFNIMSFIKASCRGKVTRVREIIKTLKNFNYSDKHGNTALIYAVRNKRTKIVLNLLKAGANVNHVNYEGWSALIFAADNGSTEIVRVLLKAGANVDQADECGDNALMYSARYEHIEIVRDLLKAGVKVDHANKYGDTALIYAVIRGHYEIVRLIRWEMMRRYSLKIGKQRCLERQFFELWNRQASYPSNGCLPMQYYYGLGKGMKENGIEFDVKDFTGNAKYWFELGCNS